jgi:hypothetical protein
MAKAEGDIKAAITAEVKRGEVKQFYVKRVETGGPGEFDQLRNEELQRAIIDQTRELAELGRNLRRSCGSPSRRRVRPSTDPVSDCGSCFRSAHSIRRAYASAGRLAISSP